MGPTGKDFLSTIGTISPSLLASQAAWFVIEVPSAQECPRCPGLPGLPGLPGSVHSVMEFWLQYVLRCSKCPIGDEQWEWFFEIILDIMYINVYKCI
jgi:hypothetical protein